MQAGHRLRRVLCAASTSRSRPAAAPAIARGLEYPHATPATSVGTSEPSECRIPRGLRGSVSRASSTSRSDAGIPGAAGTIRAGAARRARRRQMAAGNLSQR